MPFNLVTDIDYKWTLNTSPDARSRAPYIELQLLRMESGQMQQLRGLAQATATDGYSKLYNVTQVELYVLPFFSGQHHANSSTWEPLNLEAIGNAVAEGSKMLGGEQAGKFISGAMDAVSTLRGLGAGIAKPAYKTETPQVWRNSTLETVQFGFTLYNTDIATFERHRTFVRNMINYTLPTKENFTYIQPPLLCSYQIPGIRYAPIAKIDFTVQMKGQVVAYTPTGGGNATMMPDAYDVSFSLSDLLMQTRNFNDMDDGPDTSVIVY